MSADQNETNTDLMSSHPSVDQFLATILLICLLFGTPANVFSIRHFYSAKRSISTYLYLAITIIDTCSCFSHLPVMVSLYAARPPALFSSSAVCAFWEIFFSFCQRGSMFLVMTLSLTRTIAITLPFYKIHA